MMDSKSAPISSRIKTNINATLILSLAGFFAVLLFLCFSTFAFAQSSSTQNTPAKPLQVVLKGVQAANGGITGSIMITNPNNTAYDRISYTSRLMAPDKTEVKPMNGENVTILSPGELIDFKNSPFLTLSPQQTLEFPIGLNYSSSIKSGSYNIQVSVSDVNNRLLGSVKQSISVTGNNSFLVIEKCFVVTGGVEYTPTTGPNVSPKGEVYGECSVRNPTSKSVTAKSVVVYAVNQVLGNPESEKKTFPETTTNTIAAGETKRVRFPLPALDTPQVYEAISYLVDSSNTQISSQVAFRWIVMGESSLIRSVSIDLNQFKKGQEAKVTVSADPSMDLFWRGGGPPLVTFPGEKLGPFGQPSQQGTPLNDPKILVKVTDANGAACGEVEQKVTQSGNQRSWADQVIAVPMQQDCLNPKATVIVKNGDKELAQKTSDVVISPVAASGSNTSDQALTKASQGRKNLLIGLAILVIAAASIGGYLYWKKRKNKSTTPPTVPPVGTPLAVGLVFFLFATVGVSQALAAPLEVKPGQQPVSVTSSSLGITNQACNAATWQGWTQTPEAVAGQCTMSTDFTDSVNLDFLDTQNEFSFNDNDIKARVAGRLSGVGCANTRAGLIIRAYVDGTNEGVKINGGSSKLVVGDLITFTAGTGSKDIDIDLSITPGTTLACGPHKVKLELIPFVVHADVLASDPAEDAVFPKDYPNSPNVTVFYGGRLNCGGTEPCWGVLEKDVTKPCACNESCSTSDDCEKDGCSQCGPATSTTASSSGTNKVCQVPPPSPSPSPTPPSTCNISCADDTYCQVGQDGCTSCLTGATGTAKTCQKPPVCGSTCSQSGQCAGGCSSCINGTCQPPPACGTACTTKAQCGEAKDGCSECLEGSCTNFNDSMCKCDGMVADMTYPGNSFNFEAFGKVEGSDVTKAEIADVTFRMTKDNQVVAKSNPITPQIVESGSNKVRFKAAWQTAPPAVSRGSTYRVFADVRCKPKRATADASQMFSPVPQAAASEKNWSMPPKGLELVLNAVDKVFGGSNEKVNAATSRLLSMFSTPTAHAQGTNLQLQTLNFVKLMDTDNCRFVMFKYDETLF